MFLLIVDKTRKGTPLYLSNISEYKGQGTSVYISTKLEKAKKFEKEEDAEEIIPSVEEFSQLSPDNMEIVSIEK